MIYSKVSDFAIVPSPSGRGVYYPIRRRYGLSGILEDLRSLQTVAELESMADQYSPKTEDISALLEDLQNIASQMQTFMGNARSFSNNDFYSERARVISLLTPHGLLSEKFAQSGIQGSQEYVFAYDKMKALSNAVLNVQSPIQIESQKWQEYSNLAGGIKDYLKTAWDTAMGLIPKAAEGLTKAMGDAIEKAAKNVLPAVGLTGLALLWNALPWIAGFFGILFLLKRATARENPYLMVVNPCDTESKKNYWQRR